MAEIGVLGAGQLGRMMALAGYPLGVRMRLFDPAPDSPAGQVAEHIVGQYSDYAALEQFAQGLDAITYEFENVPVEAARFLAERVPVYPPPQALSASQDRVDEKTFFQDQGIPTAPFKAINSWEGLEAGIGELGLPAVLKTRRMGYDGKGQAVLRSMEDAQKAWDAMGVQPLILEGFVAFERELSIIGVRDKDGNKVFYPLVQNSHREGILRLSIAPAPGVMRHMQMEAEGYARRVLEGLKYVGVLAIELFQANGKLIANEMAPRVHNSGHWTIEGAETSQFENHVRAVAGMPLGSVEARGYSAMVNLIGTLPDTLRVLAVPGAHLHLYGKEPRPNRKIGHITLRADSEDMLKEKLDAVREIMGKVE